MKRIGQLAAGLIAAAVAYLLTQEDFRNLVSSLWPTGLYTSRRTV